MKILQFTDIHWGVRNNDPVHLSDCDDFIDWVIELIDIHKIDAIAFLGDWFESRASVGLETLQQSYYAAKKLNESNVSDVFFITGNHDILFKSRREFSSTVIFDNFEKFTLVKDKMVEVNLDGSRAVFCPFIFNDEYPVNAAHLNSFDLVFGHFEFQGFVVTGKTSIMEHGPEHKLFNKPKRIFSGHFHKRQVKDNVVFIGNPFCTNFGDVDDEERGVVIYDTKTDQIEFINYPKNPMFHYVTLSQMMEEDVFFRDNATVKCYVDVEIEFSEIQELKREIMETFKLRDFIIEDKFSVSQMSKQEEVTVAEEEIPKEYDEAVTFIIKHKLQLVNSNIDPNKLVDLFTKIRDQ